MIFAGFIAIVVTIEIFSGSCFVGQDDQIHHYESPIKLPGGHQQ